MQFVHRAGFWNSKFECCESPLSHLVLFLLIFMGLQTETQAPSGKWSQDLMNKWTTYTQHNTHFNAHTLTRIFLHYFPLISLSPSFFKEQKVLHHQKIFILHLNHFFLDAKLFLPNHSAFCKWDRCWNAILQFSCPLRNLMKRLFAAAYYFWFPRQEMQVDVKNCVLNRWSGTCCAF